VVASLATARGAELPRRRPLDSRSSKTKARKRARLATNAKLLVAHQLARLSVDIIEACSRSPSMASTGAGRRQPIKGRAAWAAAEAPTITAAREVLSAAIACHGAWGTPPALGEMECRREKQSGRVDQRMGW
jgi:hypothetical protein